MILESTQDTWESRDTWTRGGGVGECVQDDPRKYSGYMGIPGYLDKGGGGVGKCVQDDPGK